MKLIKAIKLHRKLRIKQELLCQECVIWSQKRFLCKEMVYPKLNEFISVNKAVKRIENKLPNIYFFLSDILGGSSSLKKQIIKQKSKI